MVNGWFGAFFVFAVVCLFFLGGGGGDSTDPVNTYKFYEDLIKTASDFAATRCNIDILFSKGQVIPKYQSLIWSKN